MTVERSFRQPYKATERRFYETILTPLVNKKRQLVEIYHPLVEQIARARVYLLYLQNVK